MPDCATLSLCGPISDKQLGMPCQELSVMQYVYWVMEGVMYGLQGYGMLSLLIHD